MADFPALPFWTDAYLADTTHLTTEQHGAYCLLLFKMWRMPDCNLPDDPKLLARLAGITPAKWPGVWSVLRDFFLLGDNGRWTQKRLSKERAYVDAATTRAKAAAQKRWGNGGNANADANASRKHKPNTSNGNAPTPTPNSSVPIGTDAGASRPPPELKLVSTPLPLSLVEPIDGDWAQTLFRPGLEWLANRTGKPPNALRSVLGKWLQACEQNHERVFRLLIEAERQEIADPIGWITKGFEARNAHGKPRKVDAALAGLAAAELG